MTEPTRLFDFPYHQLEHFPLENSLAAKIDGKWVTTSTQSFVDQGNLISRGLLSLGIQPGDKIAMISNNRPEWNICDMGIGQIGAINVPIYPTISEDDYRYIFNHAEIKMCLVSDADLLLKVRHIFEDVPTLKSVYTFDQIEGANHWSLIKESAGTTPQSEVEKIKTDIKDTDLATIIYTSGTTGTPKGVMLSHKNIAANTSASAERLPTEPGMIALSFLPVCHIYERMLMYLYVTKGLSIYFAESIDTIGDNIREIKPHVFSAVPRLLEKVFDKIMAKGEALTGIKKALFFWAVRLAEKWEPYGANGGWYEWKLGIADKLIFSKWREALGGRVEVVASGSAALQPRLARVFNAAGVPIAEGYGLTETSPVISVNEEKNQGLMIGTTGRILSNVDVKIAEDGEILAKGPNVMMGYYKDEKRTREVLTADGWFHTGDIGELTGSDGKFLRITDRKKEMFKTSGGKYVAPQLIENQLKQSRFIEQAMVIGEGKKHPAVLVVPDYAFLKEWCVRHDMTCESVDEIYNNQRIRDRIWQEVEKVNQTLGSWERPKKMELSKEVWTIDNEELTPTLKLRRKVILEKHKEEIERIYS
jgi:long-chain acyl-CoA synthetase